MNVRFTAPDDEALVGARVTVLGLGRFGGGEAVVRHLWGLGARVTVVDRRPAEVLRPTLDRLLRDGVRFEARFGAEPQEAVRGRRYLVVNPAVPPAHPLIRAAVEEGVGLLAEIGLTLRRLRCRRVYVTGSKGKSTTAALLAHVLRTSGRRVELGGNIGRSLLGVADRLPEDAWAVLELSSFQLEQLALHERGTLGRPAELAIVTSLHPLHLDRHGTYARYLQTKAHVCALARETLLPEECARVLRGAGLPADSPVVPVPVAAGPLPGGGTGALLGEHNARNVRLVAAAAGRIAVAPEAIAQAVASFRPLPHRLERFVGAGGIPCVDDSIATSPEATAAAIRAVDPPIVLLVGGAETGADLSAVVAAARGRVRCAVCAGEAGRRVAAALAHLESERPPGRVLVRASWSDAFRAAREAASPGDTVVLSPGFPSTDAFANFVERGRSFRVALEAPPAAGRGSAGTFLASR